MVINPSDSMRIAVQDITSRSMQVFKQTMKKLGKTLEQFDELKDQPDSPERGAVMQQVKDITEDLMYLIFVLDGLTNNLPDRYKLTDMQLHDAFDVIHEVRRLITIRTTSVQTPEVIQ